MASYPIKINRSGGRPTAYENLLLQYANEVAQYFQNYMLKNKRIASGDSISSFEIDLASNEVDLVAADSVSYALMGRKSVASGGSGKMAPAGTFFDWIKDKNITLKPNQTIEQLDYAINYSISINGTNGPKLNIGNIRTIITSIAAKYQPRLAEAQADLVRQNFIDTMDRKGIYKST